IHVAPIFPIRSSATKSRRVTHSFPTNHAENFDCGVSFHRRSNGFCPKADNFIAYQKSSALFRLFRSPKKDTSSMVVLTSNNLATAVAPMLPTSLSEPTDVENATHR